MWTFDDFIASHNGKCCIAALRVLHGSIHATLTLSRYAARAATNRFYSIKYRGTLPRSDVGRCLPGSAVSATEEECVADGGANLDIRASQIAELSVLLNRNRTHDCSGITRPRNPQGLFCTRGRNVKKGTILCNNVFAVGCVDSRSECPCWREAAIR